MKICLIGPGYMNIPPNGWGAVESLIWDYYQNLVKKNINVEIINNKNLNEVILYINKNNFDVVHIMYDDHITIAPHIKNIKKILYTSHFAYITHPNFEQKYNHYYNNIFKHVINNKNNIIIFALSEQVKQKYIDYGFPSDKIIINHNGARNDMFNYTDSPCNIDKSIYLAKIEMRKKQYKYQDIKNIDFVGNYHDSPFNCKNDNYLGEWTKTTLYNKLSSYNNLILLSDGEADPLVVKEALICGLGVIVSECSSANLDLDKPFIDVIPNDKLDDIEYIQTIIEKNKEVCKKERSNIREYGVSKFDWENIINNYINLIENIN